VSSARPDIRDSRLTAAVPDAVAAQGGDMSDVVYRVLR